MLSQGFCSFLWCPASKEGGVQEAGRGHNQDSSLTLAEGMFHTTQHHAEQWNWGEQQAGGYFVDN